MATQSKRAFGNGPIKSAVTNTSGWTVITYLIVILGALGMVLPLLWAVVASFKSYGDLLSNPLTLIPKQWVWQNYLEIFRAVPFHLYFINSLKITVTCTVGTLLTSAVAAYAFARLRFPGRDFLFMGYLATLMIPRQITLVPTFLIMRWLGLLDSHLSLMLPGLFSAYGTFLLRQFFLSVPLELEEAATIDGCGYFRRFAVIIMPLSRPALATLAIFTMMGQWNDFLYPMVFLNSEEKRTLIMGLAIFRGDVDVQWNLLMAAVLLTSAPVIMAFLSAQRFFVEGIATSGLKG
jgi:multiple sugar transport system permease protein